MVSITAMTCAGCAERIEKALRGRTGVTAANVNLAMRQAVVTYDPQVVAPRELAETVEDLGYSALRWSARQVKEENTSHPHAELSPVRPALAGLAAGLLLVGLYLALVAAVQDWNHATELLWGDRWLVAAIAVGFGLQIGLYVHLRRLNQLHHQLGQCKALTATGTGGASIAMVACCAHHLTDVLPIIGFSAAAALLNKYRVPFMLAGIGANLVGIALMLRLVRGAYERLRTARTDDAALCHGDSASGGRPRLPEIA